MNIDCSLNTYFLPLIFEGRNFRDFSSFFTDRESWYPRNRISEFIREISISKQWHENRHGISFIRESLYPRNLVLLYTFPKVHPHETKSLWKFLPLTRTHYLTLPSLLIRGEGEISGEGGTFFWSLVVGTPYLTAPAGCTGVQPREILGK